MTFTASAYAPLYWNEAGVGYLLPPGATAGGSLTLDETWTGYAGCYLIVGAPIPADAASQERFAGAVRTLLADPARGGTRFAWLAAPNCPSGRLTGPTIALTGASTRAVAALGLGGLDLVLAPECAFTLSEDDSGFTIAGTAYLSAPDGTDLLHVVQGGGVTLPLTGSAPGAVQAQLQLGTTGGVDDLTHLDAGLRVFFPADFPDALPSDATFLDSHRYPVFLDTALTFAASLDPTRPLDPSRSSLTFANTTDAIASCYLTNVGHRLHLTPAAGAKLVFAPRPPATSGPAGGPLYLVPSGDFDLSLTGANLMCGISGVEYLKLPGAGPSTLTFVPGGNAYAGGDQQQPLAPAATTSWAYVRCDASADGDGQGTPIPYCAQPDASVLHVPPQTGDPKKATPLSYLEVQSATLPHQTGPPTAPFPLLPYDGVDADVAIAAQALETAAVAPARRLAVAQAHQQHLAATARTGPAPLPQSGADVVGTTPQGLLATFSSDMQTMKRLQLALNADGTEVALTGISAGSALWTALLTNQLMLVITDPKALSPYVDPKAAQLRADDWIFDLDPTSTGDWRPLDGAHPTFLVFKFAAKPLADLAAQPGSWAQADAFNANDPATASLALQAFIADAVRQAKTDANLDAFVKTVLCDPAWNGIVALNCHTPIGGWPEQLQGLAAGIDPRRLVAHHAGVQATPVQTQVDGTNPPSLVPQQSSIFGLIDYRDPDLLPASSAPYDFKVLLLEVLIANSHVAGFVSQVTLQANQLFAEKATLIDGTDNNLRFNGTYQSANGQGSYSFLLAAASRLTITSAVLAEVDLTRAEFVTAAQKAGATIETRFLMWGTLRYEALAGFDAFAFDSLVFANLAVDMAVTPSGDPQLPASKVMAFDANHLSFDLDQSSPRGSSLYAAFPLRLTSFLQAGASTKPTDLDYAPVATPLTPGDLGAPWFGLVMQLELGGQGAWAPGGSFTANVLVAWGVSVGDQPNAFVGLQLPGTSGGQLQVTLEGPLKLSLKSVSFSVGDDGAYLLWMQSLAIGFFGLTFPPSGRTDILLFAKGNGKRTLGWYAVYDKGSSVQQVGGNQQQGGGQRQVVAG